MWWQNNFLTKWSMQAREWRHNRCIMTPLTAICLLIMALFWFIVFVLKFPTLLLGLLLQPFLHRMPLFVLEFVYPTALGRFVHLTVCRLVMRSTRLNNSSGNGNEDKNYGSHSRTLETRIEVIPNRVYIHPLPQLLDNLGYLVVCCPPPSAETSTRRSNQQTNTKNSSSHHQQELYSNNNLSSGTSGGGCDDDEGFEEEMIGGLDSASTMDDASSSHNNYIVNNNSNVSMTSLGRITIAPQQPKETKNEESSRIVAFIVDCGDAHAVYEQLQLIQERHYQSEMIYVQAILSTHKHHDHTAGNVPFLSLPIYGPYLKLIVGGAVECVPGCNYAVKNYQVIPLPKSGVHNVMSDLIQVEAVATPGHTRGSLTYILRPNSNNNNNATTASASASVDAGCSSYYLFTGDTVFSGGGGVPFEADLDPGQEENEAKHTFTSFIHASAAGHAVERCFAEILARIIPPPPPAVAAWPSISMSSSSPSNSSTVMPSPLADFASLAHRSFILPGHEYTQELLGRQLRPQGGGGGGGGSGGGSSGGGGGDTGSKWKHFPPSYFFETASHFYLAMHRRGLPQSNGKLVTAICAPLQRELRINPVFRTLKRRGEVLLPAILAWNKRFARNKVTSQSILAALQDNEQGHEEGDALLGQNKPRSTEDCWNLSSADLNRSVFCTVYTSDMEKLMADLTHNRISTATAAQRLKQMQQRLDEPLITRRPLPGTLPSDRAVYRGLLALALLGSSPTAMTLSDSRRMNLPKPIVKSSDLILVSRNRLISVLCWLGLITNDDIEGRKLVAMIHQLWKEASEDATAASCAIKSTAAVSGGNTEAGNNSNDTISDLTELGNLKWTLYGVPRQQKSSSVLFCLPCGSSRPERMDPEHAVSATGLRPHSGELVRHDVLTCPLCIDLTGGGGGAWCLPCPHATSAPLSVTTSSLQDNPTTMNGGSSSSRNTNRHNNNSIYMMDDSASSSSHNNHNDNSMIRSRPPSVLARHDTDYSEQGDRGGNAGVFGSMLLEV